MPLAHLLALRGQIDVELRRRGVIRTGSSVAGELLERMVAEAHGGRLSVAGTRSVDVVLPDGRTVQTKARWLEPGETRRFEFGDLDFDVAVVALMDRTTFALRWAREIPVDELRGVVRPYQGAWRVPMAAARRAGLDVTTQLQVAFEQIERLDELPTG